MDPVRVEKALVRGGRWLAFAAGKLPSSGRSQKAVSLLEVVGCERFPDALYLSCYFHCHLVSHISAFCSCICSCCCLLDSAARSRSAGEKPSLVCLQESLSDALWSSCCFLQVVPTSVLGNQWAGKVHVRYAVEIIIVKCLFKCLQS